MTQTENNIIKLLSCSTNFCVVVKLIILVLMLFISINGSNGEKVQQKCDGYGVSGYISDHEVFNEHTIGVNDDANQSNNKIISKSNGNDSSIDVDNDEGDDIGNDCHRIIKNANTIIDNQNVGAGDTNDTTTKNHYNFIANEWNLNSNISNNEPKERVLSRQRRYLVFPEGSSIQVGMSYMYNVKHTKSTEMELIQ